MIYQQAELAKIFSVSRQAINNSIKRENLFLDSNGFIDDEDIRNKIWFDKKRGIYQKPEKQIIKKKVKKKIEEKKEALKKPEKKVIEKPENNKIENKNIAELTVEKMQQEIRVQAEREKALKIKRLKDLGVLVEAEKVRQAILSFNADLRIRILEFPASIVPRISAMIKSGSNDQEIISILESEISKAIEHAKKTINRQF